MSRAGGLERSLHTASPEGRPYYCSRIGGLEGQGPGVANSAGR